MPERKLKFSEILELQLEDTQSLYDQAKMEENVGQMEKFGKVIQSTLKQIKDHQLYERETMKRAEVRRKASIIGISIGQKIKKYVKDQDLAALIIEDICDDVQELIDLEDDE